MILLHSTVLEHLNFFLTHLEFEISQRQEPHLLVQSDCPIETKAIKMLVKAGIIEKISSNSYFDEYKLI